MALLLLQSLYITNHMTDRDLQSCHCAVRTVLAAEKTTRHGLVHAKNKQKPPNALADPQVIDLC